MQKFDTPAPISAVLNIPAGHVRFIAADRVDTTVEVRPANASKDRDVKAAERTTVDYRDGVLRIEAPKAKSELLGPSGALEVTVQLPAGSRVEATAAAAEFRGVGRLGEVSIDGAHGSVKFDEVAGARLALLAGDALVGRLDGPAEITSGKGDLRVTEATGGTVTLRTGHGEISVGPPPASRPRWTPPPPTAGSATRSGTARAPPPGSTSAPPPATATSPPAASDPLTATRDLRRSDSHDRPGHRGERAAQVLR